MQTCVHNGQLLVFCRGGGKPKPWVHSDTLGKGVERTGNRTHTDASGPCKLTLSCYWLVMQQVAGGHTGLTLIPSEIRPTAGS